MPAIISLKDGGEELDMIRQQSANVDKLLSSSSSS